jgi:hypothetical protein
MANDLRESCRIQNLSSVLQEIKAAGGEATAVPLDVGSGKEKIDASIDIAIGAYGHIDVLVRRCLLQVLSALQILNFCWIGWIFYHEFQVSGSRSPLNDVLGPL